VKYIRTKTTIATLYDGHIDEDTDIRDILTSLKQHELSARMKLKNHPISQETRIIEVNENDFKCNIIGKQGSLFKRAVFSDIEEMEVDTSDEYVLRTKPGITRWNLLNPADST
jgi:hypothetical protein